MICIESMQEIEVMQPQRKLDARSVTQSKIFHSIQFSKRSLPSLLFRRQSRTCTEAVCYSCKQNGNSHRSNTKIRSMIFQQKTTRCILCHLEITNPTGPEGYQQPVRHTKCSFENHIRTYSFSKLKYTAFATGLEHFVR